MHFLALCILVWVSIFELVIGYPYQSQGVVAGYTPAYVSTTASTASTVGELSTSSNYVPGYIRYIDNTGVEHLVGFSYPKPEFHVSYVQEGKLGTETQLGVRTALATGQPIIIKEDTPEMIKARDEHFRIWTLQQYQALRQAVDQTRVEGKEPSTDMINKFKSLERIISTADYNIISELPEVKSLRIEHLRLWKEAALKSLQPATDKVAVVYQRQQQPLQQQYHQQYIPLKSVQDDRLRIYNEQIALLKQLENKRLHDLQQAFVATQSQTPNLLKTTPVTVEHHTTQQQQHPQHVFVHQQEPQQQQKSQITGVPFYVSGKQPVAVVRNPFLKTHYFGSQTVQTSHPIQHQQSILNQHSVKTLLPVPYQTTLFQHTDVNQNYLQQHPVVSVYSGDTVPKNHYTVQQLQNTVGTGVNVAGNVPQTFDKQNFKLLIPNVGVWTQASKQPHQSQQSYVTTQQHQIVIPTIGNQQLRNLVPVQHSIQPIVQHGGVAVLKTLEPNQHQHQSHENHFVHSPNVVHVQDTPEVVQAREEHLRLYNEIKTHAEQQENKIYNNLKIGRFDTGALTTTSDENIMRMKEIERRHEEDHLLEVERQREAERILEEKKQRELERIRETERLAEERRQMETELWRLRQEEKNRLEMDKLIEKQHLRKQEIELKQQQQPYKADTEYKQENLETVTPYGVKTPFVSKHLQASDADANGNILYYQNHNLKSAQTGQLLAHSSVESEQQLRTTSGLTEPYNIVGDQKQHQHQHQTSAASGTTYYVVPLTGIEQISKDQVTGIGSGKSITDQDPSTQSVTIQDTVVDQIKPTTLQDLEKATREHFRAHEVALKQLRLAALKDSQEPDKDCK